MQPPLLPPAEHRTCELVGSRPCTAVAASCCSWAAAAAAGCSTALPTSSRSSLQPSSLQSQQQQRSSNGGSARPPADVQHGWRAHALQPPAPTPVCQLLRVLCWPRRRCHPVQRLHDRGCLISAACSRQRAAANERLRPSAEAAPPPAWRLQGPRQNNTKIPIAPVIPPALTEPRPSSSASCSRKTILMGWWSSHGAVLAAFLSLVSVQVQ